MRKLYSVCLSVLFCFSAAAQSTLIGPSGDGGFETGSTFALNNWTAVSTGNNKWYVGSAAFSAGTRGAYIDKNGTAGTANTYNNGVAANNYIYRDVTFPVGATNIVLSFQWRAVGESLYDSLGVYLVPTTTTITAGVALTSGSITTSRLNLSSATAFSTATINLPASLGGSTQRLVFAWANDGSLGSDPPGAIDEISLTYTPPPIPQVVSFTPASGCANTQAITITGTGLSNATDVSIGGTSVASIVSNSNTQIVVLPSSGTTGQITVTSLGGSSTSAGIFTINPAPAVAAITGTAQVCAGGGTTVFSDATSGGVWSITNASGTASVSATGTVTGTAAGNATVNYAYTSGGCTTTVTAPVLINPTPAVPIISPSSAVTICSGSIQTLTANSPATATLFAENFESGGLGAFTLVTEISGPAHNSGAITKWANKTSPFTPTNQAWSETLSSGSKFVLANSDAGGITKKTNVSLVSPVISTVGYTSLTLSFNHYYHYFDGPEGGYVEASVDGGTTWTQVTVYTNVDYGAATAFTSASLNLNAYIGQSNFKFRFRYYATWDWGWAIDDVLLAGTGTNNMTWSPTTGLYSNAAATTAYTGASATTVYAKPTASTTYTATAQNGATLCTRTATVTVNITQQPNATFSYTGSPYCASGTASVTASGTAGLTGGTFSSTAGLVFSNASTGLVNLSASSAGTYTVTYNYAAAGGCTAYTATTTITIQGNAWLGVNTNWFDPLNWCAGIPTATTDVLIPAGLGNYPIIISGTALAKNITIASGASVIVNGSGIFSLNGAVNNTGVFNITSGTLNLAGSGSLSISGSSLLSNTVKNLTVSKSASIAAGTGNTLRVSGFLSFLTSANTLTTNGNLTLLSSAAGTARIADITHNGATLLSGNSIAGNASVERYISAQRKWNFLSVNTVTSQTVQASWMEGQTPGTVGGTGYGLWVTDAAPAVNFDAASYTPTIKWWNGAAYTGITDPTAYALSTHNAYMTFVRGDRASTSTNSVLHSTVLRSFGVPVQNSPAPTTVTAGAVFTPIGNPYASAIDLTKLAYSTSGTINLAVWDPNLTGSQGLGAFQTFSSPGPGQPFIISPGGGSYVGVAPGSIIDTIESGQAYFMQGTAASRTVTFNETSKVDGARLVSFAPGNEERIGGVLSLVANGAATTMDGFMVRCNANYNTAVDFDDARKFGNTGENVSVIRENTLLAMEYRGLPDESDTVFINMSAMRAAAYEWNIYAANMDQPGRAAFLVDRFTATEIPLSLTGSTLSDFTVSNTPLAYAPNRFYIVFRSASVLPVTLVSIAATRQPDKTISVSWQVASEISVYSYIVQRSANGSSFTDMQNSSATNNTGGSAAYEVADRNPLGAGNYYRIKIVSIGGQIQYSAIVKVAPVFNGSSIVIYPNPIAGRVVSLKFTNEPAGSYGVQVTDGAARTIATALLTLRDANELQSLRLPATVSAGSYDILIIFPNGDKKTIPIVVH